MNLKLQFMKKRKIKIYQVECNVFMGGSSILYESTSKSARNKEYKKYNEMDGDPYEVIGKRAIKEKRYLKFKKL